MCNSCRSVRIGEDGRGDTLMEAVKAVLDVLRMGMASHAYTMLLVVIKQARANGACYSCICELEELKSEIGKYI